MTKTVLAQAHSLEMPLPPGRIHTAITSPPYWAMRQYHTGDQKSLELGSEALADCLGWATGYPCGECFTCHMVGVFREVGRVLHPKGTLWLNLGDAYLGSGGAHTLDQGNPGISRSAYRDGMPRGQLNMARLSADRPDYRDGHDNFSRRRSGYGVPKGIPGLKAKDLAGIPWRVAFALQADGWYLRSAIVWRKPNPMVESAPDRPTNCYEFIFLLSKSRRYYYDREAVREPLKPCSIEREKHARGGAAKYAAGVPGAKPQTVHQPRPKDLSREPENPGANKRNVWDIPEAEYAQFLRWRATQHEDHRDVWDISTAGYKGQHFATFPIRLPDICIRAGTSEAGCCPKCFTPYVRVLEPTEAGAQVLGKSWHNHSHDAEQGQSQKKRLENMDEPMYRTVDWRPDCECYGELQAYPVQVGENTVRTRYRYIPHGREPSPIPCTVLDPFAGTGTTLVAARALGRDSIGLDLSYRYLHDEAAVRLSSPEWDVWENGIPVADWIDMDLVGLPLFGALAAGLLEEE